jgi:hypothetical protein
MNDDMVGFANASALEIIITYLFTTYSNTTAVDLDQNFDTMRKAGDLHQSTETLFKQIQDSVDFSEAGGVKIGAAQQSSVSYTYVFGTCILMSAFRSWNEKEDLERTWNNFKTHFSAAYHQHNHIQGESATTSGYHAANAAVAQTEDEMDDATIEALTNLATSAASYSGVVTALTEANERLAMQLKERSHEVNEIKALPKKELTGRIPVTPSLENYCWSHGYKVATSHTHTRITTFPKDGRKKEATTNINMGGSQANTE